MGIVEELILDRIRQQGAVHMVLIDPDKTDPQDAGAIVKVAEAAGTTAVMIGGSTAVSVIQLGNVVNSVKKEVKIPVILFPSNVSGITPYADAIWFMSLLNSTNPFFITGSQALGASLIKKYHLEPLPMGYIIVGRSNGTAGFIGQANPIPYTRPEVAALYALAAQYLGMRFVYLEAGSGAEKPVPSGMISYTRKNIEIPLIIGGGIRGADEAEQAVKAGADIIVTGNMLENNIDSAGARIEEIVTTIQEIKRFG